MQARDHLDVLAAQGQYHFTTKDAEETFGGTPEAVRARLRRLKQRGWIASPQRTFHVIVPPEYRHLGCLPAEHFIDPLLKLWGEPYYVALLSAAERYGAAHQRPQTLQVMVRQNRAPIVCGQVRVNFIARGDLEQLPTRTFNTPRGELRYATPEVTALELVGYPRHAGGLSHVATVLAELAEELALNRLLEAARLSPVGWSQRLGYLLERVEAWELARGLAPFVASYARSYTPLRRAASPHGAERVARWKLLINTEVEPDL